MQQRAQRPSCIIIDSASEEHEGSGGLLDFHDSELERMAGSDWAKRERVGQAAWIKPKANRLEMLNGLMQITTPLIFCFRAREKTKQVANAQGKQVPTNIGWTPIAPPEIVHSMDIFALLPIKSDGVPMWKGNTAYEDFSIKLPRQFASLFPADKPINQQMGQAMSVWALGDQKLDAPATPDTKVTPKADTTALAEEALAKAAHPIPPGDGSAQVAEPTPAAEVATAASSASTATEPGSEPTGEDTSAATVEAGEHGRAESSPPSSSASPASADGFPGDRDPAGGQEAAHGPDDAPAAQGQQVATGAPASGGFVDFAASVADANDWPQIEAALLTLTRTDSWTAAPMDMRATARRVAYVRLRELNAGGYRFDFITNLQAWRSYIEYEEDVDALTGNRRGVSESAQWKAAPTNAKIALDKAFDSRIEALKARTPAGDLA